MATPAAVTAAASAMFMNLILATDATYRVGGVGDGVVIRAVRKANDELIGGAVIGAMTRDGRAFIVRRSDFGSVDPRTGDTIEVDGVVWRVKSAEERSILAGTWTLMCKAVG